MASETFFSRYRSCPRAIVSDRMHYAYAKRLHKIHHARTRQQASLLILPHPPSTYANLDQNVPCCRPTGDSRMFCPFTNGNEQPPGASLISFDCEGDKDDSLMSARGVILVASDVESIFMLTIFDVASSVKKKRTHLH